MDIKVREVTDVEEKSSQQIEQELLDKHEQQQEVSNQPVEVEEVNNDVQDKEIVQEQIKEEIEAPPVEEQPPVEKELAEDEVLSYIGKRYGKEINSIDELISTREESEPLPEDVAAYLNIKKKLDEVLMILQNCKKIIPI